jgi:hypothetical protein
MERRYASLAAVETRERQSGAAKREEFQRALGSWPAADFQKPAGLDRAANPAAATQEAATAYGEESAGHAISPEPATRSRKPANRITQSPPDHQGDLQRAFERAKDLARKSDTGQQERTEEADPDKLEQARDKKDELEKRQGAQERNRKDRGPDRDPGDRER